jgi:hypothetical protein
MIVDSYFSVSRVSFSENRFPLFGITRQALRMSMVRWSMRRVALITFTLAS